MAMSIDYPAKPLHQLRGIIRQGRQRGRDLGYPTANMRLHQLDITDGIYISRFKIKRSDWLPSLTFIGPAKTFHEQVAQVETFILDWSGDLYGQWGTVHLIKKIRENKKFTTVNALIKAIEQDVNQARRFFFQ